MVQWKTPPQEVKRRLARVESALAGDLPADVRPRMIELKAKLEMMRELQGQQPSEPTRGPPS